jgi:hypothetical protein
MTHNRAARLRQDVLRQIEWCRGNLRDPELHAHIDDLIAEFARAVQTDTHNETFYVIRLTTSSGWPL